MPHRIGTGLARVFVQVAALLLMSLIPAPASDAVRRPPGYRIFVAGAEIPVRPPYLSRRRPVDATEPRLPSRLRPYLVAHEQRLRRRVLLVAADGIDIGPWTDHGPCIGSPAGASMAVAA